MYLLLFLRRVKKAATDDDEMMAVLGRPPIRPCIHGSHAQRNRNKNTSFYGYSNKR